MYTHTHKKKYIYMQHHFGSKPNPRMFGTDRCP